MLASHLVVLVCSILVVNIRACRTLLVASHGNRYELQKLALTDEESLLLDNPCTDSGRAIYKSKEGLYIYHLQDPNSGVGMWVLSTTLCGGAEGALAYKESWSVEPELTNSFSVTDNEIRSSWVIPVAEASFQISCTDRHDSVYFDSSPVMQPQLAGFYIARDTGRQSQDDTPRTETVYVLIKHQATDAATYLFHLPPQLKCRAAEVEQQVQTDGTLTTTANNKDNEQCEMTTTWLIGDRHGVDAGLAYTIIIQVTTAGTAAVPEVPSISSQWHFVQPNGQWAVDPAARLISVPQELNGDSSKEKSLFEMVQSARSLRTDYPLGHKYKYMRSKLPIPEIGLGTGGVYLEDALDVFTDALTLGYRLFDLAREYGNEHIVPQALQRVAQLHSAQCELPRGARTHPEACRAEAAQAGPVARGEVFLQSKVWPTELGFEPTSAAIMTSLRLLQTNYIDHYMLHWPECDSSIDWMHCETTIEPAATWRESWRALERAYAEGRLLSLGVSNFNTALLEELRLNVATVLPHLVQNWAEPGNTDRAARAWCDHYHVLYQPYAPLRNLRFLPATIRDLLKSMAERYGSTEQAVVLRFFLQTGALVIPRSSSWLHLQENLLPVPFNLTEQEIVSLS